MSIVNAGGGSNKPQPPVPNLKVGEQVRLNPEHRQAGPRDEDFLSAGPLFVEERYSSSSGTQFYRVANSAGEVVSFPGHQLSLQTAPLVGALVPGLTLPVVGEAVRLTREGQEISSREDFFQSQPVIAKVSNHVATLRNEAGQEEHYNLSLLQRQGRDSAMQIAGAATPGMGPIVQQLTGDPLVLLEGLTGQTQTAAELWKLVEQSPDEKALERVQLCFQQAPERAAGANLALKALQTPDGLAVAEHYLRAGGEDAIQSAHQGLELSRELQLSPEQMPWLFEVTSWKGSYAGDRAILKFLLESPDSERRQSADLVKDFLLPTSSFEKPWDTAERAVQNARDILSMKSDLPPDQMVKVYRSFLEGWRRSDSGLPLECFKKSGLDEPGKRSDWQRYRDLGFSSKSAVALSELERELDREEMRGALHTLAASGNYTTSTELLSDLKILERPDRPPGQSLEDRLNLVACLARASRGRLEERETYFKALERAFPNHEALVQELEGLPYRVGAGRKGGELVTLRAAAPYQYAGESVGAAGRRLADLDAALPKRLDTAILQEAFQWLSTQPREHYQAYQQALLAKLDAECPLIQAQSELGLAATRSTEPIPNALRTLVALGGELSEESFREAVDWLYAQPPQDYSDLAGRLIAQSKLKGSLQGAMEALERPLSGVREEVGGVTFGGVRLKRRS